MRVEGFLISLEKALDQEYKRGVEDCMKKIKSKKFKRGERLWCIECADRIINSLK